jgi:hypothetical protein
MTSVAPEVGKTTMSVTGVTVPFTAKHVDPVMAEGLHGHTWVVTAFWPAEPLRDGRCLKAMLATLLEALPDVEGVLPAELWSGEDIARTVARLLAGCVGARVTRSEGFEAWIWL